ncbi:MAG: cation diffusion facilitator family transporter, partial [Eubacteriales bacterium]
MITLISKIFINNRENTDLPEVRGAYGKMCGIVGIILNIILFASKLTAGMISGAISITADAFNNLSDAGSSVITLLGFRMAGQKPDRDHPFGHGRIEYVSGLIVSMLIIIVGFELGKSSVEKIISPEAVEFSIIAVVILAASVLVKAYMAFYNFKIGKKISSAAMKATGTDSLSDCVATGTVLVCLLISHFFNVNIDAYCGLAVAAFIIFSGLRSAKETIDPLLGTPPTKELIGKISEIVYSYGEVKGIHDLIVHDYGPGRLMISLHAEVPSDADMLATHDMIDNIEKELREKLNCDAVIHMDPIVTDDGVTCEIRKKISELVKCIDRRMTIHDFRMVSGPTHTNVIFDVVVP